MSKTLVIRTLKEENPITIESLQKKLPALQVRAVLKELFLEGKVRFISPPGPTELGAEPVSLELNWVELTKGNSSDRSC